MYELNNNNNNSLILTSLINFMEITHVREKLITT